MSNNVYNGVRAEPKFLRDPTSFESISSGISRLSSYVASNLQKRKSSMTTPFDPQYQQFQQQQQQQQQHQRMMDTTSLDNEEEDTDDLDTITFSAFEKLEYREKTISCLLLGYHDGFQIWDITNPDNVHEIFSIRDKDTLSTVSHIHILNNQQEPVLAIVAETNVVTDNTSNNKPPTPPNEIPIHTRSNSTTSITSSTKTSHLLIYSLHSQSVIKEINDFQDEEEETALITSIKSNDKVIAIGCVSRHRSSIHLLSCSDFTPFASPLTDVFHDPQAGPLFTLGSRFIAYATNTAVLNSDPVMSSLTNKSMSVLQGDKDVKGAAKDIAKEVVSGMKTLGEFGYNRLSNYFNNNMNPNTSNPPPPPLSQDNNLYNPNPSTSSATKKMIPSGMIMIRDILKLPKAPTRNLSLSTIAHFRPHTHPVSCLKFNQAGTLLMSASKQGHTFHIFSILTKTTTSNAVHLYSLSRGITDAQVEDCQFSVDSTWCAITTARGTTHVYAINPYGGKPEISGHVHGKVNNPVYHPFMNKSKSMVTVLNSVVRIKQRRKMPGSLSSSQDDLHKYMNPNGYMHGYYNTPPHYIPQPASLQRNTSKDPRAKITTMFVTFKSPYLLNSQNLYHNNNNNNSSNNSNSSTTTSKTPTSENPIVGSIKQQASQMLSSFGANKKFSTDTAMMFGFDEEYDDSAKMINDEIGYQDIYSFHPDGILTLHRCWIAKTVVKKRENGRTLEKLDLSLKEEDIAEWRVARNSDWEEVWFTGLFPSDKKTKKKQTKKLWLSNAEITTYGISDEPALWTQHQFSFQTYQPTKDLPRLLHAGIIPNTDTMILLKGMPEPVKSRIDRVSKTTTRIENDSVEENMDDALAELEDNISKAMQTSFSPSSNSIGNSPANNLKWLSSSANAAMNASPSRSSYPDKNSSLSFEDAYLIHMGSGPSSEPIQDTMQHSSLIQFDDDEDVSLSKEIHTSLKLEEEAIEAPATQIDVFSPDGDNEVAYPYESVFGDFNRKHASDDEQDW